MTEFISTWNHIEFPEPLELVRRDSLQPGDVAYSSHYGKSTVKAVDLAGDEGETTHIIWETPSQHVRSERYPSYSRLPLVSRAAAAPDPLRRIRQWVDEHINQVPDDAWGEGYHAAVKRMQAEIEGIDRVAKR